MVIHHGGLLDDDDVHALALACPEQAAHLLDILLKLDPPCSLLPLPVLPIHLPIIVVRTISWSRSPDLTELTEERVGVVDSICCFPQNLPAPKLYIIKSIHLLGKNCKISLQFHKWSQKLQLVSTVQCQSLMLVSKVSRAALPPSIPLCNLMTKFWTNAIKWCHLVDQFSGCNT